MTDRVAGKTVLITGAAISQGRSHAVRLAEEGANIIATDACAEIHPALGYPHGTEEKLAETRALVEAAGGKCVTAVADVRDVGALRAAVDEGLSAFGRLDVVVANAGIHTIHHRSWEIDDEVWDVVIDVNQKGVFNTFKATVPALIEGRRGGSIISTTSSDGVRGYPNHVHYTASKWAVVGMTKTFANELGPHRIRVNTIAPCGVIGEGAGTLQGADPTIWEDPAAPVWKAWSNLLPDLDTDPGEPYRPVGAVQAREVSEAVLWLASDEARYVTAQVLAVDAGNTNTP